MNIRGHQLPRCHKGNLITSGGGPWSVLPQCVEQCSVKTLHQCGEERLAQSSSLRQRDSPSRTDVVAFSILFAKLGKNCDLKDRPSLAEDFSGHH